MLHYATVGSNDLPRAVDFYEALLGSIGMAKTYDHPSGGRIWGSFEGNRGAFAVLGPANKEPASVGNGSTFGFGLDSPEAVAAFHAKALELGATNEGAPGKRGGDASPLTFAYFRDLDGNKICAFHHAG